jgi:hypothetical protein
VTYNTSLVVLSIYAVFLFLPLSSILTLLHWKWKRFVVSSEGWIICRTDLEISNACIGGLKARILLQLYMKPWIKLFYPRLKFHHPSYTHRIDTDSLYMTRLSVYWFNFCEAMHTEADNQPDRQTDRGWQTNTQTQRQRARKLARWLDGFMVSSIRNVYEANHWKSSTKQSFSYSWKRELVC